MKIYTLALSLLLSGCYLQSIPDDNDMPVYKFNPIEKRYEITQPSSEMHYNVFTNEWQYIK